MSEESDPAWNTLSTLLPEESFPVAWMVIFVPFRVSSPSAFTTRGTL